MKNLFQLSGQPQPTLSFFGFSNAFLLSKFIIENFQKFVNCKLFSSTKEMTKEIKSSALHTVCMFLYQSLHSICVFIYFIYISSIIVEIANDVISEHVYSSGL